MTGADAEQTHATRVSSTTGERKRMLSWLRLRSRPCARLRAPPSPSVSCGRGASGGGWLVANVCVRASPIAIGAQIDMPHRRPPSRSQSAWASYDSFLTLTADLHGIDPESEFKNATRA